MPSALGSRSRSHCPLVACCFATSQITNDHCCCCSSTPAMDRRGTDICRRDRLGAGTGQACCVLELCARSLTNKRTPGGSFDQVSSISAHPPAFTTLQLGKSGGKGKKDAEVGALCICFDRLPARQGWKNSAGGQSLAPDYKWSTQVWTQFYVVEF